eukprot:14900724-Alexandrium_andersonii.AAC.1
MLVIVSGLVLAVLSHACLGMLEYAESIIVPFMYIQNVACAILRGMSGVCLPPHHPPARRLSSEQIKGILS